MSSRKKIDLAYFYDPEHAVSVDWKLGETRALALPLRHLVFTVDCLLRQTNSEWILFWDFSIGQPNMELISELIEKQVDVWHSGLKLGQTGRPSLLNYVDPVWMYNRDASETIEHTSFRLSLQACLIRTDVLRKTGSIPDEYHSLSMTGIAMGYSIFKQGGIIRYHPHLVQGDVRPVEEQMPDKDEWIFARQFFTQKWQLWSLFNHPALRANYKLWSQTRHIQPRILKPHLHSATDTVVPRLPYPKVSVLVPTLNRYSYLLNVLAQLSSQTVIPWEVLITDQTDKDKRVSIDFDKHPNLNIRYFPQEEKGQVIAWNKLMEEARGEYLLFLDDDADGMHPSFIEKLLLTQQRFDCDMVAANVVELGIKYDVSDPYYFIGDVFPITLLSRSVLSRTGFMDMFFNRNIRADGELAMRCHLSGTLMIFDPAATIGHHRAPAGGLRTHNARVVTNYISKNSISKFVMPTSSEIYLMKKHFSNEQYKNSIRIKYMSQLSINGGILRKLLRALVLLIKMPSISKTHKANVRAATKAVSNIGK